MDWYSDVFGIIFPDVVPEVANAVWDKQLREKEVEGKEKKRRKFKASASKSEEEDTDEE